MGEIRFCSMYFKCCLMLNVLFGHASINRINTFWKYSHDIIQLLYFLETGSVFPHCHFNIHCIVLMNYSFIRANNTQYYVINITMFLAKMACT